MLHVVITKHFNDNYIEKFSLSIKQICEEIKQYHEHHFKTQKRRKLHWSFDKIQVKNKVNKSRKEGARMITEILSIIEVIENEKDGSVIFNYTPELLFDVNEEAKYNKKLQNEHFMKQLQSSVKIHSKEVVFSSVIP